MSIFAKLRAQVGILTVGIAAGLVVRFAIGVLVARWLGAEEFGRYAAVVTFAAMVSRMVDLGLPNSFAYYYRVSPGTLPDLLRLCGLALLGWAVVVPLIVAGAAFLPISIGAEVRSLGWSAAGVALLSLAMTGVSGMVVFLNAAGRFKGFSVISTAGLLLEGAFLAAVYVARGPSFSNFILAQAAAQMVYMIALFGYIRIRFRPVEPAPLSVRDCLVFGLRAHWAGLMKLANARLELLILHMVLGPAAAGFFSIGVTLRDLGLIPLSTYAAPLQNLIIDTNKSPSPESRSIVLVGLLLQFAVSLLAVVLLVPALPFLIPLVYGEEFAGAVVPAIAVFCGTIFMGASGVAWVTFNSKGKPHFNGIVLTLSAVVMTAVVWFTASRWGLLGAGLGSAASAGFSFLVSLLLLSRLEGWTRADVKDAFGRAPGIVRGALKGSGART